MTMRGATAPITASPRAWPWVVFQARKAGEVDERGQIVGAHAVERVAIAPQRELDRRRHGLPLEVGAEIAQVPLPIAGLMSFV